MWYIDGAWTKCRGCSQLSRIEQLWTIPVFLVRQLSRSCHQNEGKPTWPTDVPRVVQSLRLSIHRRTTSERYFEIRLAVHLWRLPDRRRGRAFPRAAEQYKVLARFVQSRCQAIHQPLSARPKSPDAPPQLDTIPQNSPVLVAEVSHHAMQILRSAACFRGETVQLGSRLGRQRG